MLIDRGKYLQHIREDDQLIEMKKLLDRIEMVIRKHEIQSTDFLDPYQLELSKSILNRFDINYIIDGGYNSAERNTITIFPEYLPEESIETPVRALLIEKISKFNRLEHRDFLGALMGTGIKREKIGDIHIEDKRVILFLHEDILDYIKVNLTCIGKESVELREINRTEIDIPEIEYNIKNIVVSSMRLDAFISEVYGLSRSKSKSIINSDRVKVNWRPIDNPSFEISKGDMISVRKKGRITVGDILGSTRKDNIRVEAKIHI